MGAEGAALFAQVDILTGVLFVGVLVTFLAIAIAIAGRHEGGHRALRRRIARIQGQWTGTAAEESGTRLKRNISDSSIPSFDRLIKRIVPPPAQLRRRLERTGRRISLGEYALTNLLLCAVTAGVTSVFLSASLLLAGLLGITVGIGLPYFLVGRMGARRMARFLKLFPGAIDLIVRGLKSGLPVTESIALVGQEIGDPVGGEFRRISDGMKIGQTMEEALWEATARVPLTDFKFFVISLSVQKETGGNLTETLDNLSIILRRRQQMKLKIKAMASEARASAYIIGALPFILGGIIYMLNEEYAMTLFLDPRGRLMLGLGLGWLSMGALVMAKMARFEI